MKSNLLDYLSKSVIQDVTILSNLTEGTSTFERKTLVLFKDSTENLLLTISDDRGREVKVGVLSIQETYDFLLRTSFDPYHVVPVSSLIREDIVMSQLHDYNGAKVSLEKVTVKASNIALASSVQKLLDTVVSDIEGV